MNVPLDRLYHFLEDVVDDDILIYRFSPHGSKKLCDLLPLYDYAQTRTWMNQMLTPVLICHDQEPLNFAHYTPEEIWKNYVEQRPHERRCASRNFEQLIKNTHLRSCVNLALNVHDLTMISHSEKNSAQVDLYQQHGFVGVYWWSHAFIAQDWFRYAQHDRRLQPNFDLINQDFLIYNRAWTGTREYRLTFAEQLVEKELVNSCRTAFNPQDNGVDYRNHRFVNPALCVKRNDLENYFKTTAATACYSADYDSQDYQYTAIEVVLETLFDDCRQHLTEKALRPIACGRPFILVSTAGSLQYLQDYGFETFSEYIDESYDQIKDPIKRMSAIVDEMKRISQLPPDQKTLLWNKLYEIAKKNQQLFFDTAWVKMIVDEYQSNFKQARSQVQQSQQATLWKTYVELCKTDPVIAEEDRLRSSAVRQSMQELENYLKTQQ